jgi:formylglycine-generating enzyme required for sulfatase activity
VTVAQFRAFVEATGLDLGDGQALRELDTRPVSCVSWHQAIAHCDWLTEVLRTSSVLETNEISRLVRSGRWHVTLPSELEWRRRRVAV